ncbi:hypothetical protein EJ05DRAFT_475900, partial [Pseudovirgaria hyperparasitica]
MVTGIHRQAPAGHCAQSDDRDRIGRCNFAVVVRMSRSHELCDARKECDPAVSANMLRYGWDVRSLMMTHSWASFHGVLRVTYERRVAMLQLQHVSKSSRRLGMALRGLAAVRSMSGTAWCMFAGLEVRWSSHGIPRNGDSLHGVEIDDDNTWGYHLRISTDNVLFQRVDN